MDDLVWSVTPKNHSQDRKKLLVILPKLLKWLDQGLQFERKSFQLLFDTTDKTEGMRARLDKRPARFGQG